MMAYHREAGALPGLAELILDLTNPQSIWNISPGPVS